MSGRRWVLLALVAVVAFAAAFVVASGDDDEGDDRSSLDVADLDALSAEARELVALADRGRQLVHHAVYEQTGGDRLEVWTDGTRVREETTPADGDRRLVLRTEDGALECIEAETGWSCEDAAEPAVGLQSQVEQLVADLTGAEVAASDGSIADIDVRCFAVSGAEEPVEICLTPEGVLARLSAGEASLELVTLDDDVDGDRFDPPEP